MTPLCVHRWLLRATTAAGTPGRCRRCGAERTFTGGAKFDRDYDTWHNYAVRGGTATSERRRADALADEIAFGGWSRDA